MCAVYAERVQEGGDVINAIGEHIVKRKNFFEFSEARPVRGDNPKMF